MRRIAGGVLGLLGMAAAGPVAAAPAKSAPAASGPAESGPAESGPASLPASAPASAPALAAAPSGPLTATWTPPPPDYGARYALSLQAAALRAAAISLLFERMMLPPRWTLAVGLGVRFGREGDYAWLGFNLGLEGRWYFVGRGPIRHARSGGMVGPWLGARVDVAAGRLRDRVDRDTAGTNVTLSEIFLLGYRLSLWGHVEVTLYGGAGFYTDFDPSGRLAPHNGAQLTYGVTVGWLFGAPPAPKGPG